MALIVTQGGAAVNFELDDQTLEVTQGGAAVNFELDDQTLEVTQGGVAVCYAIIKNSNTLRNRGGIPEHYQLLRPV